MKKIKKHLIVFLILSSLLYLLYFVFSNYDLLIKSFSQVNLLYLPLLFLLSFFTILTRFAKWQYYLKILKIIIPKKDSFGIFMSSLVMSLTPGRFGELSKSYMLKEINDTKISYSATIILVERITEIIGLIIIVLFGLTYLTDPIIFFMITAFILSLILFLKNRVLLDKIIKVITKGKFLRKLTENIDHTKSSLEELLKFKHIIISVILSVVSWIFEVIAVFIILSNFDIDVSFLWSSFVYSFSLLIGSVSMIPAGLGLTDISFSYLLMENGFSYEAAGVSAFLLRLITLWFFILLGTISLALYKKRYKSKTFE